MLDGLGQDDGPPSTNTTRLPQDRLPDVPAILWPAFLLVSERQRGKPLLLHANPSTTIPAPEAGRDSPAYLSAMALRASSDRWLQSTLRLDIDRRMPQQEMD